MSEPQGKFSYEAFIINDKFLLNLNLNLLLAMGAIFFLSPPPPPPPPPPCTVDINSSPKCFPKNNSSTALNTLFCFRLLWLLLLLFLKGWVNQLFFTHKNIFSFVNIYKENENHIELLTGPLVPEIAVIDTSTVLVIKELVFYLCKCTNFLSCVNYV